MFEKLFELLVKIWDSLTFWYVIKDYEGGVLLRLGRYNRTLEPGLAWKRPFVDHVITTQTVITTMNMRPQTLTTRDGKGIVVSAIVKYRVRGVREYILGIWDAMDVLQDVTMGAIREVINRTDYADLFGNTNVETSVLETTRKEVNQFGFQIFKITFVDLGLVRSIRLIGNGTLDKAA